MKAHHNKSLAANAGESTLPAFKQQNETALFRDLTPALVERFGPIFFPCGREKGKKPLETWRLEPITAERIEHWREKHPYANIGMALGNGIACIDVDINDEDASNAVWNQIVAATDGLGVVYPRTREGSARWAALIKVDGPMQKGVLTFTEHGSGQGSRAIEYLCDGQFVVIAGWHDSGNDCQWLEGAPWETDPDDLASFKVGDVRELVASLGDAVVEQCGWVVGSNGVGGGAAEMTGNGGAEYMPTGKMQELEADDIRKIYKPYVFTRTHYDHGISDTNDLLGSVEQKHGIKSKGYRDVAWEIASVAKYHNDEGQELAFEILYTDGVHDDESYVDGTKLRQKIGTAFKDFGTREQAWTMASRLWINELLDKKKESDAARKLSREKRNNYLEKLDSAGTAENEDAVRELEDTIRDDAELSPTDRDDVIVPAFRKAYNAAIPGASITDATAKKRLALTANTKEADTNKAPQDEIDEWFLPGALIEDALNGGAVHFKDEHDTYYIEFESGSAMPVLSPCFVNWALRKARKYGQVANKTLGENIALNVEADLEVQELPIVRVERRLCQIGTGRPDDPFSLYVDMSNDKGQLVHISAGKVNVLQMTDAPVKFIKGAFPAAIVAPETDMGGLLRERVERFWHHMPVPEAGRMQFLGTLVNAFFTANNQPILCLHDKDGGTAKSPTIYRWRQLLDPKTVGLPSAPTDMKAFKRMMGSNTVVAFDDISKGGLSPAWQKKLNTYSTGGTDETPTFYKTEGNTVLHTYGALGVSTNHRGIFTNPETYNRVVFIEFEPLGDKWRSEGITETEFADEVDALRWTLFELVSEVIKVLPKINDRSGHRFKEYARIVNALHKILKVEGSLSQSVAAQTKANLSGLMDSNQFIMDTIDFILRVHDRERLVEISPSRLWKALRPNGVMLGDAQSGYPTDADKAKSALTANPEAFSLMGLDVSEPSPQQRRSKKHPEGEYVRPKDSGGLKMRLTLNDNAQSRAETEYDVIDDVSKMIAKGVTVPAELLAAYEKAQFDEL